MSTTTSAEREDYPFLDEFLVDLELQGQSDETIRTYRSNLRTFIGWLEGDPRELTQQDLKDFLYHLKNERSGKDGSLGVSDSTIANYFSCINSYYRYLKFEGQIDTNVVPEFRERYVPSSRDTGGEERQLISVEEMSMLVHATLNLRDRAIIVTLAKTGVRRGELVEVDLADIDWEQQSIQVEETAKRDNCLVFFDGECARVLERWLSTRRERDPTTDALFLNQYGDRLKRNGYYEVVTKHAETVGLHDPDSDDLQERFTPHCCRHWFTTHLRRSGMPREFIQELRGDTRGDAIDVYDHIDREELREAYLAHIPSLGV
jgi:integrase/recombinase XerD